MKFNIGDIVTWRSQAGGYTTQKTGIVVKIVNRPHKPRDEYPRQIARREFPNHRKMFNYGWSTPGNALRAYFVEVKTSEKSKPKLYMPYPSKLHLVEKKQSEP